MEKLVVFGSKMDVNKELELILNNDNFGFHCIITFHGNMANRICQNCTEFHHLFDSVKGAATAFESDIHSTGQTMEVSDIKTIEIIMADELCKSF